ncbi:MAG: methyltransferase domain-containing protein [Planctomycetota bacterium]
MTEHKPKPGQQSSRRSVTTSSTVNGSFRTLGPVADLERHLPTDWWQTLFNSLYLKTDGDVVENNRNTSNDIDLLIKSTGAEPNDRIMDICCGQGRHCLELARRGFKNLIGIDRSRYLVRLARKRASKLGLNVHFREGDARKLSRTPDSSLNIVSVLGNSFGYFDKEEDDAAVVNEIRRALVSRGILALDITDGEYMKSHFDARSWEWIDANHFVCRERSLASDNERLVSRELIIHAENGVLADQFYAERLYSREKITDLLTRCGFQDIRFHNQLETASDRNQDLGMMGCRMFLTAVAPSKAKPTPSSDPKIDIKKITVLMGDPTLSDSVKRNGQFNPEDFETINRLKSALGELSDNFEFSYVNNHATMMTSLKNDPPQLVLNLCDEGYKNDAFMELHVPAMIETLEIAYTGAPPRCLAACYDKSLVRSVAASIDIPVPAETYFAPSDQAATLPSAFPAIIKPNWGDSSIGITQNAVVHNVRELMEYLQYLREILPGRPAILQEFLPGTEYSVGIIGNPGSYRFLPVLEVDYSNLPDNLPKILGYESKWIPDSPYWTSIKYHAAALDEATERRLYNDSARLFERLECQDYARFDFRTGADGVIKLMEVNPNPGWCWDGKFNYMAGFAGMRYADMLRAVLESAINRIWHA